MEITTLTIKILFILFPGMVSTKIINRLTERKKENIWEFFIRAFIYGISTYMLSYLIIFFINYIYDGFINGFPNISGKNILLDIEFYKNILNIDENITINYHNIFITTSISIFFSFIISKIDNKGYLNKFAQKINVTNKIAENDVWLNIFNGIDENCWITIRDVEKDIMYQGWPQKFSSFHEDKELLLRDVVVYQSSTGNKIFERELMYFNFKNENDFIMEIEKS